MALRLLAIVCLLLSAVHAQEEGGEGEGGGEEENGRVKKKIKIINTMLSTVVNHSAQLHVEITDMANLSRVGARRVREVIVVRLTCSVLRAPLNLVNTFKSQRKRDN